MICEESWKRKTLMNKKERNSKSEKEILELWKSIYNSLSEEQQERLFQTTLKEYKNDKFSQFPYR